MLDPYYENMNKKLKEVLTQVVKERYAYYKAELIKNNLSKKIIKQSVQYNETLILSKVLQKEFPLLYPIYRRYLALL